MTLITMSNKELNRFPVIKKLINKEINGTEAAKQLGLSIRHVKRLKGRVRRTGAKGLIHRGRGKLSNRAFGQKTIQTITRVIRCSYPDFGPTLAREKLEECHGIRIGNETLRTLMIANGLWKPRPRKNNAQYRQWRERKESYGEMQQFDGSYHRWFEERALECCLLAAIDDATGKITQLRFAANESVRTVFSFWKDYCLRQGKPVSIYLDKYSTYKINHPSAVDNKELLTQFERATGELGIKLITAHSPQAKGRVERLFKTLQDRLVKELRIRNISDWDTANRFLEETFIDLFNRKFSVRPANPHNLHRSLNRRERQRLNAIFSVRSTRAVNNDFTIRFKNQWFQLAEQQPTTVLRTDSVLIEERLDDTVRIRFKEQYLDYAVLPKRPEKTQKMNLPALTRRISSWKPPANHPWRQSFLYGKQAATVEKQKTVSEI